MKPSGPFTCSHSCFRNKIRFIIQGPLENVSSVSPACRKRRLNGAVSWNNHIKWWPRVSTWVGTLKNPTKCLWRWEPDRRSNFFIPPAHLCAVTYITEISLHVTLRNKSNSNSKSYDVLYIYSRSIALKTLWLFLYTYIFTEECEKSRAICNMRV